MRNARIMAKTKPPGSQNKRMPRIRPTAIPAGISGIRADGQPHGGGISDPVAKAAAKRERLLSKIHLVDTCAKSVGGGEWYAVIIQNVCIGKSYENIDKALMPTSRSNSFFRMRREFFRVLDEKKEIFDGE